MDGKDAIINDIITNAERKAAAAVADATAQKDELLEKCRNELARKEREELERAQRQAELSIERRQTLAVLDGRKAELAAKQAVIDKVYDAAITKTLNMTDNVYREFIAGLIEKYADDGDEVMIAERDSKRLNYDWVSALGAKLGKDLTLSSKYHHARGGVVLVGYKCDKNLTLDTIVAQIRLNTESEIASRLFSAEGEKKNKFKKA